MIALLVACAQETPALSTGPRAGPPNVLLVSIDTVRADRLSTYGYARDTSPSLTRLASRGVVYTRAYSGGNESVASHATLLTGRWPSEIARPEPTTFGVPPSAVTLAEALAAAGYDTAAFTGGGHLVADFGFAQGFDTFRAPPRPRSSSLHDSVPDALGWLARHTGDKPWFVFVHGYDGHAPFTRPGPFRHLFDPGGATPRIEALLSTPLGTERIRGRRYAPTREVPLEVHANGHKLLAREVDAAVGGDEEDDGEDLTDAEIAHLGSHYDAGLAWGDLYLGLLLAALERRGDLDRTLIVVTSDHGEDLLDHGYVNHRMGLWDSTTHVPLVIAGPGFTARHDDRLVEASQVMPTLLWAAGVPRPMGMTARAVQDEGRNEAVFSEGELGQIAVRTDRWRLVYTAPLDAPDFVSRLRTATEGFALFHDEVPADDAAMVETLRARLVAWREGLTVSEEGLAATPAE